MHECMDDNNEASHMVSASHEMVADVERIFELIAVPGLTAKSIIDMMALASDVDELVTPIIVAGCQYLEAHNALLHRRRWFCRPDTTCTSSLAVPN